MRFNDAGDLRCEENVFLVFVMADINQDTALLVWRVVSIIDMET